MLKSYVCWEVKTVLFIRFINVLVLIIVEYNQFGNRADTAFVSPNLSEIGGKYFL